MGVLRWTPKVCDYVTQKPFGSFCKVLGHYFTYLRGPGIMKTPLFGVCVGALNFWKFPYFFLLPAVKVGDYMLDIPHERTMKERSSTDTNYGQDSLYRADSSLFIGPYTILM